MKTILDNQELQHAFRLHFGFELLPTLLVLKQTGSRAYGIGTSESDMDYRGVFIPPPTYSIGLWDTPLKTWEWTQDDFDVELYPFRHWCRLLTKANPDAISLIFSDPEVEVYYRHHLFGWFEVNRDMFIQESIRKSFSGLGKEMLRKLEEGKEVNNKLVSHAVRNARMGTELLRDRNMRICRVGVDCEELKAIRYGKLSSPDILKILWSALEKLKVAKGIHAVNSEMDTDTLNKVMMTITYTKWEGLWGVAKK